MRQFFCQVIFMTEKENVPFTCMLTDAAAFPSRVAQPVDPNHGSHPGNACPGTPDPNLNLHRLANTGSWSVLEQHFCNEQGVGNLRPFRVLMCFSLFEGCWYCAFVDEDALYKRLPRRLKFSDGAKVFEAAKREHARLEDQTDLQEFERSLVSGHGKIWLHLTSEQRSALRS